MRAFKFKWKTLERSKEGEVQTVSSGKLSGRFTFVRANLKSVGTACLEEMASRYHLLFSDL